MKYKKILATILTSMILITQTTAFAAKKDTNTVLKSQIDYLNFDWWKNFNDPYLEDYINRAILYNKDLQLATLTLEEYNQLVKIQLGKEFPSVGVGANYIGQTVMGNMSELFNPGFNDYIFAVPLVVRYEADIFGKNHNKTASVRELKKSIAFQEKSAYISVSALVASTYLNIIQYDRLISLQKDIIDYRKTIYELMSAQHECGFVSLQDTISANKSYTVARMQLTNYEKERDVALHAFAVLLGDSPENSGSYMRSSFDDISKNISLPQSISSDVIINRPDVQAIEAELKKASIDVKIARKEFLPSINLNGFLAFNAIKQGQLINSNFGLLALAPGIMQSLFTGGQKIANLKLNKVRYEKMLKNYEKTNLIAIQEINDTLVKIKYDTQQDKNNAEKLNLEKQNEVLARESYDVGAISKLEYTQYKELLATAESDKVQSSIRCLINAISLYKATGAKI